MTSIDKDRQSKTMYRQGQTIKDNVWTRTDNQRQCMDKDRHVQTRILQG